MLPDNPGANRRLHVSSSRDQGSCRNICFQLRLNLRSKAVLCCVDIKLNLVAVATADLIAVLIGVNTIVGPDFLNTLKRTCLTASPLEVVRSGFFQDCIGGRSPNPHRHRENVRRTTLF